MRVMILTWEYPPKRLGKISGHVFTLSHELVRQGHEVEVITEDDWETGFKKIDGVYVHRVANPVKTHHRASVLTSVMTASIRIEQEASNVIYFRRLRGENVNLIHAHEWLTIPPSISLRRAFNLPLVLTLHSLEGHRCHDAFWPLSIAIREVEDTGIRESARVIANTGWMKNEILRCYGKENENKIDVVQPGKDWINTLMDTYNRAVRT